MNNRTLLSVNAVFIFGFTIVNTKIVTAQSWNWNSLPTRVGGVICTANNNTVISTGHTVTVKTTDAVSNALGLVVVISKSISLDEVVFRKENNYKVTSAITDVKITLRTSLDIISGILELVSADDVQGRNLDWSHASHSIIVYKNGLFFTINSTVVYSRNISESNQMQICTIYKYII
jgi:hypothetical protein